MPKLPKPHQRWTVRNPPDDIGQTCEPQGARWKDGKLYLTTRHRGILVYDPTIKTNARALVILVVNRLTTYSAHVIEIAALPRTSHSRQRSLDCKSKIIS